MSDALPVVYLARHGETAWTISRQHTGVTDLPLTTEGEAQGVRLGKRLEATARTSAAWGSRPRHERRPAGLRPRLVDQRSLEDLLGKALVRGPEVHEKAVPARADGDRRALGQLGPIGRRPLRGGQREATLEDPLETLARVSPRTGRTVTVAPTSLPLL